MLRKIQEKFYKIITPSEGAYPLADRALGLIPLGVSLGISAWDAQTADTDYKPFAKPYSKTGLPLVLGLYGLTQLGLTHVQDKIEQIENTTAKGFADFFVGLFDTWNNVPIYAYGYNMLSEKWNTNYVFSIRYLPKLISTIENDIKALVKGEGEFGLTSWDGTVATIAGYAAKNLAVQLSNSLQDSNGGGNPKATFASAVLSGAVNASAYKVFTGLLNPFAHDHNFMEYVVDSIAQEAMYETQLLPFLQTKFDDNNSIFRKNSALGGALLSIVSVETLLYLFKQMEKVLDHSTQYIKNNLENPELGYTRGIHYIDGLNNTEISSAHEESL